MAESHRTGRIAGVRFGLRPNMLAVRAGRLLGAAAVLVGVGVGVGVEFGGIAAVGAAQASEPPTAAGSAWAVAPTPNQDMHSAAINLLSAISCTSKRACTAVGSWEDSMSSPSFGLAERWDGTSWRIQPTALPKGALGSELRGVSCTSAITCTAVGYAFEKTAHRSVNLAEVWNGTKWRLQTIPDPKHATNASPLALSCSSPSACTAVGFYANHAGQFAMAERWNGKSWRLQALPKPSATELYGVSCSAEHACVAVGHYTNTSRPFAEAWNGKTWHIQSVPLPQGTSGGMLAAVSCTSPRACTATGGEFDARRPMLAERWNGKRWSVQAAPSPADVSTSRQAPELNGVSCRSSKVCVATGEYAPGGQSAYFLEAWKGGRWQLVSAPHPAGFGSGALNGVSCAPTRCIAVGAWSGGTIDIATLVVAG